MIQNFHTNHFINLHVKYIDNKIQDARQTISSQAESLGMSDLFLPGISSLASLHVLSSMHGDLILFMHRSEQI